HLYPIGGGHFHLPGGAAIKKDQELNIRRLPLVFLAWLFLGTGLLFLCHSLLLEALGLDPYGNQLAKGYLINILMAAAVFFVIYRFRNRYRDLLGYFFLGGSLLKFVLFFIFLQPGYQADGLLERVEFLAFFVPYLSCLVTETFFLVKLLNNVD